MKADLWRYSIIYTFGGVYVDADATRVHNDLTEMTESSSQLVVVPENEIHLCQWVFAAPPHSPVLREVIEKSVQKIMEKEDVMDYGEHFVHECTGPGVFTEGIEQYLHNHHLPSFTKKTMYRTFYNQHPVLHVLDISFHHTHVQHHFTGFTTDDGWTYSRDQLVTKT
jgi:mannosyltransferase OCH1-like enzyme